MIKGGTLYPLLTRYENAGLVSTNWRAGDGGPGRKYFTLTEHGRAELTRLSAEWLRFASISTEYMNAERPPKEFSE
ncbi:MAG: putative transcriptional regulator, PadR family [Pseudarthrobacter sp.]|nr:putative transcriptional regulator, PadR family [Pseudarthrobacter sp.]